VVEFLDSVRVIGSDHAVMTSGLATPSVSTLFSAVLDTRSRHGFEHLGVGQHRPRAPCFRSFRESLSLGLTDRRTVAAYVHANTTRLSARNYTTSRDATRS
jgi:hypothetical protein